MIDSKEVKTDVGEQVETVSDLKQYIDKYIDKKIQDYIEPYTEKLYRTHFLLLDKIPQIDFLEARIEGITRRKIVPGLEEKPERTNEDDLIDEQIKQIFNELANKWKNETTNLSSMQRITGNSAYLSIIGLGPSAIPLIFDALRSEPDWWFCALRSITREDPVTEDMRGDINAMTDAWLNWGRKNGYVRDS